MLSSEELRATRAGSPFRDEQKHGCAIIVLSPVAGSRTLGCGDCVSVLYYTAFPLVTAASFSVSSADYAFFLATRSWLKGGEGKREGRGVCCKGIPPFHGWRCLIPGDGGNTGSVFNPEPLESCELVALSREGRERLLWTLPSWGQESPVD